MPTSRSSGELIDDGEYDLEKFQLTSEHVMAGYLASQTTSRKDGEVSG